MLKSYLYFFYILLILPVISSAQNNELLLFLDDQTIIGRIAGNDVYVSETQIGYTLQGNMIFKGTQKKADDILFIINAKDILGKKAGIVYQNDSKTVQYITLNGSFFFGDYPIDKETELLLNLLPQDDSTIIVRSGINDSILGYISGSGFNSPNLVLAAHLYIMHFELDRAVSRQIENLQAEEANSIGGVIRPLYTDNAYFDWVWDGKTLKPGYGNRPEDEWKFDGRYLKPVWNLDPRSEWVWENDILKPYWDSNVELQWVWEDLTLRPFWAPDPSRIWVIEEDIVRPMWNFDTNMQWVIEGDIPLPLIALVILGFADRP